MAIVTYLRVSTEEQAESGLGLEAQLAGCREFAVRHGVELGAVFPDEGRSGSLPLEKRTILHQAIEALRPGDRLLVYKLDRLSRGDPYEVGLIERLVKKRRARILSAKGEGTEDDSTSSITNRRINNFLAEIELLKIRERTRDALRAKVARGERCGQVPYGYQLGEQITITKRDKKGRMVEKISHKIVADPREDDVAFRAAELRALGVPYRRIARGFQAAGIPTKSGRPWRHSTVADLARRHLEQETDL